MSKLDKGGEKADNKLVSFMIHVYVLLIGVGLPLFVQDGYFDILEAKYYYYLICTIPMVALFAVSYLPRISHGIPVFSCLTVTDYFVLIFYLVAVISTVASEYRYESFWGNEGRYNGLFLITWYVMSYVCVSRLWRFKRSYVDSILIVGVLVCLFGITDYFQMDIFGFKEFIHPSQISSFTSTIGNINTYTAYVAIIMAMATVLFATSTGIKRRILSYVCMVISFFAIIMGVSDNAYLSLAALFLFLPFYLFSKERGVEKYLLILVTFLLVIQITAWLNARFAGVVLGMNSLFRVFSEHSFLPYLIGGLVVWMILWHWIEPKIKARSKNYGSWLLGIWMAFLIVIFAAFAYILYDCNIQGNVERYRSFETYLFFNDAWGTNRGYVWRNAMEEFAELSFWKKLVGFGPETFGILLMDRTYDNPYHVVFDSAHNEYLHLLLTVGILGVASYVLFLLSYVKQCFCGDKNPYRAAIAFGVICYSVQAFVNINIPIVTGTLWLLLGIGRINICERSDMNERQEI